MDKDPIWKVWKIPTWIKHGSREKTGLVVSFIHRIWKPDTNMVQPEYINQKLLFGIIAKHKSE